MIKLEDPNNKRCSKCRKLKSIFLFHINIGHSHDRDTYCKECRKIYDHSPKRLAAERIRNGKRKEYKRKKQIEFIAKHPEYNTIKGREWRKKRFGDNKEALREYYKKVNAKYA